MHYGYPAMSKYENSQSGCDLRIATETERLSQGYASRELMDYLEAVRRLTREGLSQ